MVGQRRKFWFLERLKCFSHPSDNANVFKTIGQEGKGRKQLGEKAQVVNGEFSSEKEDPVP